MPRESARIALRGNRLRIEVAPKSILLMPMHRIFFTNVLEFDAADDFYGYSIEGPGVARLVIEAVSYIESLGIAPALDVHARHVVSSVQAAALELSAAEKLGRKLKIDRPKPLQVPHLRRPLKPYQIQAARHLFELAHAANFSVPGSGKTAIVLAAFSALRDAGRIDKMLVVGPRASFMPWEEEVRACLGDQVSVVRIVGSQGTRRKLYRSIEEATIALLTYQVASNDSSELAMLLRRYKIMFVLDESHNIKRLEGGKWASSLIELAPLASKRVILSGTPMPNSILDLWSQVEFLWPGNSPLGDRDQFKFRSEEQPESVVQEIRASIDPLYWRIRKRDLGLPPPRFHRIAVTMSRYQLAIYKALAAKVLADVVRAPEERVRLRLWRRARMVRLLQAASNPALLTKYSDEFRIPPLEAVDLPVDRIIDRYPEFEVPRKLATAVELARKLVIQGKKVLVWTAFVHNIRMLQQMLEDVSPAVIYGDVPRDEHEDVDFNRERIIQEFKSTSRYRVLIANPSACAESVSLHTACHDAIYLDRTFNAAHYMQSLDRIHRVGLPRNVSTHYYVLLSNASIDEVIDTRLDDKRDRMLRVLNDDIDVVSLEADSGDLSEEGEEAADFEAVLMSLRARVA